MFATRNVLPFPRFPPGACIAQLTPSYAASGQTTVERCANPGAAKPTQAASGSERTGLPQGAASWLSFPLVSARGVLLPTAVINSLPLSLPGGAVCQGRKGQTIVQRSKSFSRKLCHSGRGGSQGSWSVAASSVTQSSMRRSRLTRASVTL